MSYTNSALVKQVELISALGNSPGLTKMVITN